MEVVTRAARARGAVHLGRLDLALGSEIQKTRPCLVVSPDDLNETSAHGHRGAHDDRGPGVSVARAMSLPAALGVRGFGSTADGRGGTPSTSPRSSRAAK